MDDFHDDVLGEGAGPRFAAFVYRCQKFLGETDRPDREKLAIDTVPAGLPACLDTAGLMIAVVGTPMAAGLALVAHDASEYRRREEERPPLPDEEKRRADRRGLSRVDVKPEVLEAIMSELRFREATTEEQAEPRGRQLFASDDGRVLTDHLFSAFPRRMRVIAFAGAFFVDKVAFGVTKLRAIVDGRSGNSKFWTTDVSFPLFSLEAVMRVVGHLGEKPWFAINADLRHYFHQIPLPDRLRAFYVLRDLEVAPVAVPMGSAFGPYVAQCCTWGMLFACEQGRRVPAAVAAGPGTDKTLSSGLSEATLRRMYESPEDKLPPWIPLEGGGGIFVILDNILVATPEERVARFWRQRIDAQTRRFKAQLKLDKGETLKYITVPAGAPAAEAFEFLGYQWSNKHHRVYVEEGSPDAQMAGVVAGQWAGSHRELASNLGKIYWWARGRDLTRQHEDMVKLHELYKVATPPAAAIAASGHRAAWSQAANRLTPEGLKDLQGLWAARCSNEWQAAVVFSPPKLAAMVATDASLDASRRLYGFVCFPSAFERVTPADFEGLQTVKGVPVVQIEVLRDVLQRWWGAPNDLRHLIVIGSMTYEETRIALGELRAIVAGVRAVLRLNPHADIVIIATDSLNAKAWVENKWSSNPEAMALIIELLEALCGRRIYVVYVASELNCSDAPSRGELVIPATALLGTWRCLQHGLREALQGVWSVAGGQAGGAKPELRLSKK